MSVGVLSRAVCGGSFPLELCRSIRAVQPGAGAPHPCTGPGGSCTQPWGVLHPALGGSCTQPWAPRGSARALLCRSIFCFTVAPCSPELSSPLRGFLLGLPGPGADRSSSDLPVRHQALGALPLPALHK